MTGALVLGTITFADFEIPERLVIGGKQQLVVHSLPGGRRVVDAMGPQDAPVFWRGIFSGPQAAERVRSLESMRQDGRSHTLTFDAWRLVVVIEEFEAQITSSTWIPYRIKLCVVSSAGLVTDDWLDRAASPLLTVGSMTVIAAEDAISLAGSELSSADVGQAIGAAGNLAQLVTARALGLFGS